MVTNIIQTITSAFTGLLSGIGSGVVDLFDKLFLTTTGELTTFAMYAFIWLGISLATGMITFLIRKIG